VRDKFDCFGEYKVCQEQSPEERACLLGVSVGLLFTLSRIIAGFGQGKVEGREQETIEKEGPLRDSGLEDGIERPWVLAVARERVSELPECILAE
jgi:hypothetical protein